MNDQSLSRKKFLMGIGTTCACSCACALAANLKSLSAESGTKQTTDKTENTPAKKSRSQERIEFTEKWAVRFFREFDANLDAPTRKKIMMANGKACLLAWQKETNQQASTQPMTLERLAQLIKEKKSPDYQIEGNVIYFQFSSAAETGLPSPENHCLCPMVENKPTGLSPTFCLCSLGYVKEMHEQMFKKPIEVELLTSVLRGDPRCKFKITVS
ncbi:MAG: hypothetical protein H6Q04_150 [Acidobacteria bacterium]|nr:hypothetical protein [Acidobacteriota bacterium]